MILNRLGNKKKIASKIHQHFPEHDLYLELFFGAGGMFFNKPDAKYNIVNDLDYDVYNLFNCIRHRRQELIDAWKFTPVHSVLFKDWRKKSEQDPIFKAVRFLVLSNFSYMGKGETLRLGYGGNKPDISIAIDQIVERFVNTKFTNFDFRVILKKIALRGDREKARAFIYCDPPYLGTDNNYSDGFKIQDSADLFSMLQDSGIKWAMSEFDHPFIIETANKQNLNIIEIGERKNLGNRRTEYLITNYQKAA